jgi:hypothetical protein
MHTQQGTYRHTYHNMVMMMMGVKRRERPQAEDKENAQRSLLSSPSSLHKLGRAPQRKRTTTHNTSAAATDLLLSKGQESTTHHRRYLYPRGSCVTTTHGAALPHGSGTFPLFCRDEDDRNTRRLLST